VVMTQDDVRAYEQTVAQQGSSIPVTAGERLTERQLLLALMLPSANNIAVTLARWVSGSEAGFVELENATALRLGMTRTHFEDASGFDPRTVSTARDLSVLARAVLSVTALSELVQTRTATLPDGTVLDNLDSLLGTDPEWQGIKTGWTPAAGGCLLFAARRRLTVAADPVTVYGAVLGEPPDAAGDAAHPELGAAFTAAHAAVTTALSGYASVDMATLSPSATGAVTTAWGAQSGVRVEPATGFIVVRAGDIVTLTTQQRSPAAPLAAGATVLVARGTLRGHVVAMWHVITVRALPAPNAWWRITHA